MAKPKPIRQDAKAAALARDGALNPHPEAVRDPLFSDNPFFDPRDLVQVRYEMVRRHQVDSLPISDVADVFGVSRPTFYKAQSASGRPWPRRSGATAARTQGWPQDLGRGPRLRRRVEGGHAGSHHAAMCRRNRQPLWRPCAPTKPRAGAGAQKKTNRFSLTAGAAAIVDAYERLRAAALGAQPVPGAGLATLRRQGMAAWVQAARPTHGLPPGLPARLPPTAGGPAASELTLILASLVVTLAAEPSHA